jgi:hypothetical protein
MIQENVKELETVKVTALFKEFIELLDRAEMSDNGRWFFPVELSSCRLLQGEKMNRILLEAKEILGLPPRPDIKALNAAEEE